MLTREAYWVVVIAITLFAFIKGEREEWFVMAILILGTLLTRVANDLTSGLYDHMEWGVVLVDCLTLAALTTVALFTRRFWPLWVAGFQLASSSAHLLRLLHTGLPPYIYAVAERFWIYPMLIAVLVGTFRAQRYWSAAPVEIGPQPS